MKAAWFSTPSASSPFLVVSLTLLFGIGITTGCGSSGTTPPKFSGNTLVTVLLASTGNDQVTRFGVEFQTLTLTSPSGKTVALFSNPLLNLKEGRTQRAVFYLQPNLFPSAPF